MASFTSQHTLRSTLTTMGVALLLAGGVLGGLFILEQAIGGNEVEACWSWKGCGEQVPYCRLNASQDSIANGQSTELTWSTGGGVDSVEFIGFPEASYPTNGSLIVTPSESHTYRIVAKSSERNSTSVCEVTVSVGEACLPGTCTMSATPDTITKGEEALLVWETTNVESGSIDQGVGSVPQSGSVKVTPEVSTTYTGTFIDTSGKTLHCSARITVEEQVPDPFCSMGVNPTSIIRGEEATLFWESTAVIRATIDQDIGEVGLSSNLIVKPTQTTTYTGTFEGQNGETKMCSATLVVQEPQTYHPSCTLDAVPEGIIRGNSATLSWSTVDVEGSGTLTSLGTIGQSGSAQVTPTTTTVYTAHFTGKNGAPVNCMRTVTVTDQEPKPKPVCSIGVNPATITKGASATLTWASSHATSGVISSGIGAVPVSGAATITPQTTTTYTGTFTGAGGSTTCSGTITVVPPTEEPLPVCSMQVSPTSITSGGSAVLSWTSENATGATLSNDIGTVATSGSTTVTATEPTTYTGTFTRGTSTVSCSATLSIVSSSGGGGGGGGGGACLNCDSKKTSGGGLSNTNKTEEKTPSPTILLAKNVTTGLSSITLAQVPYTGFTAGPVTTVLFWIAVLVISALIAYVGTVLTPLARLRRMLVGTSDKPEYLFEHSKTPFAQHYISLPEHEEPYALAEMQQRSPSIIENMAHNDNILISPEAERILLAETERGGLDPEVHLRALFEKAKASYSREDGWILLSKERVYELMGVAPQQQKVDEPKRMLPHDSPLHDVAFRNIRTLQMHRTAPNTTTKVEIAQNSSHSVSPQSPYPQAQNKSEMPVVGAFAGISQVSSTEHANTATTTPFEHVPATASVRLLQTLANHNEQDAFAYVREMAQAGMLEKVIAETVTHLDAVYRHRIEGNHTPHQDVLSITSEWSNAEIARTLGYFVECVDHSYENTKVGVKIALTKLFVRKG